MFISCCPLLLAAGARAGTGTPAAGGDAEAAPVCVVWKGVEPSLSAPASSKAVSRPCVLAATAVAPAVPSAAPAAAPLPPLPPAEENFAAGEAAAAALAAAAELPLFCLAAARPRPFTLAVLVPSPPPPPPPLPAPAPLPPLKPVPVVSGPLAWRYCQAAARPSLPSGLITTGFNLRRAGPEREKEREKIKGLEKSHEKCLDNASR